MYTVLRELFSHTLSISCKQCRHALAPFVLNLDGLPRAGKSLMVQNNMARIVKFSRLYASHTCTLSFHSVTRSSSNGARYISISFPGCFGSWINSDIYIDSRAKCYVSCSCYRKDSLHLYSTLTLCSLVPYRTLRSSDRSFSTRQNQQGVLAFHLSYAPSSTNAAILPLFGLQINTSNVPRQCRHY